MPNENDHDQPNLSEASLKRREKKQEIRAQKERQQKAARRRQGLRKIMVLVSVALIVAGGVILISRANDSTEERRQALSELPNNQELLGAAGAAAKKAGCTPVKNVGEFEGDEDASHAGAQPLSDYPSVPPASGPHNDSTVAAGVYDQPLDIGAAIHSLEHGAAVVWYSPDAADSPAIVDVASWIRGSPENTDHTIMAPFDYPDEATAGSLPDQSQMALVAWHNVMLCDEPSLPVVIDFMSKYRYPPVADKDYVGEAPEQGVPI